MPAAAVIPAPIAYIKVVAVKKLVVGFLLLKIGRVLTDSVPGFLIASSRFWYLVLIYRVFGPCHLL